METGNNFQPFFAVPKDTFGAFAGGIVGAFFAFAGWWEVTRIAGEIENPQKNLPKALIIGVIVITIIYILTSAVFFYLVPISAVTSDETFAAQAGEALFGKIGGIIFAAIVIISVLGTLVAYLMVSPRVYYAMAQDELFFKSFGEPHPRFNTPHRATIIQIFLASILILAGNFEQILSYFFFVVVLFIALVVAGLFKIHNENSTVTKRFFIRSRRYFFWLITTIVLLMIAMRNPLQSFSARRLFCWEFPFTIYFSRRIRNPKPKIRNRDVTWIKTIKFEDAGRKSQERF